MNATAKELRTHTRRLLEAVDRGEEVTITFRGRPRAKLVAADSKAHDDGRTPELFGLWRDHAESVDVAAYVRTLRQGRP